MRATDSLQICAQRPKMATRLDAKTTGGSKMVPEASLQTGGLVEGAFKVAATAKFTVQTLRRNISVLMGAGGNIAVLTGPDGKVLVDAEIVTARPHVSTALARINADPVKQLINTHWHFDHTGGNEWIHQTGATILAQ